MILKFQTVKGAAGDVRVLSYIQAGADQEAPMFTNMGGGSVAELVREVSALRSMRPKLNKAGAHLIMSHDPSQRALSESEWREALDIALAEHGAENAPYAAWLHTEKEHVHLHVFLLRIRSDGSVVSDSNSYRKNERAARSIEARFGLDPPKPRAPEDRHPRDGGARAERGRRRFERLNALLPSTDQPPQKGPLKVIDPKTILDIVDEAQDPDDLRDRLLKKGIECEFVQAPGSAEPTGWSLRQAGPAGTWIKGSDVHRNLSLKKVLMRMEERRRQRQATASREVLGDLLDGVDDAFRARLDRDAAELDEEYRVAVHKRQKGLAALLLGLPVHAVAVAIGSFINFLTGLVERVFGLPHQSLGRIHIPEFKGTVDVPVGIIPPATPRPDASASEFKRRALALKAVDTVLDQACTAIEKGRPDLLPGLTVKDAEAQTSRAEIFKAIEESREDDDADQDNDEPYERECPR